MNGKQSVEGGPWTGVGSGASYPGGAPALIGATRIRRKVSCGNQILFSDTLSFTINYTSANAENLNYLRVNDIMMAGVYSWTQADQLSPGQKQQTTTYFDGLGRKIQEVGMQISPQLYDWVTPCQYDSMGRESKNI